jgi:3-sulfinopropanoyl-CoA desulfinase
MTITDVPGDLGSTELRERARELTREVFAPRAAHWDETEEYPFENAEVLAENGFMGMTIPKEYGGQGASIADVVAVVEEVAKGCGVTARIVVDGNLGALSALTMYGTDEQKREYYPGVLAGDKPVICITEPRGGSDAGNMETTAVKDGDSYVINGTKSWITGARDSDMHLMLARVIEDGADKGIGGFLIHGGHPGMNLGKRHYAMGLRGIPEMEMNMVDCRVPASSLLKLGLGNLLAAYNNQRLGASAVALGIAQGAFDLAVDYAKTRVQFGRPICEFQGLQWNLVDCRIELDAARLLIHRAATDVDRATSNPRPENAAIAKVYASESAIRVTDVALQIFGAHGYGRDLPLERMYRDVRMFTLGGGTAQIQRNLVATAVFGRKFSQERA